MLFSVVNHANSFAVLSSNSRKILLAAMALVSHCIHDVPTTCARTNLSMRWLLMSDQAASVTAGKALRKSRSFHDDIDLLKSLAMAAAEVTDGVSGRLSTFGVGVVDGLAAGVSSSVNVGTGLPNRLAMALVAEVDEISEGLLASGAGGVDDADKVVDAVDDVAMLIAGQEVLMLMLQWTSVVRDKSLEMFRE